jgi:hypothetical protein
LSQITQAKLKLTTTVETMALLQILWVLFTGKRERQGERKRKRERKREREREREREKERRRG